MTPDADAPTLPNELLGGGAGRVPDEHDQPVRRSGSAAPAGPLALAPPPASPATWSSAGLAHGDGEFLRRVLPRRTGRSGWWTRTPGPHAIDDRRVCRGVLHDPARAPCGDGGPATAATLNSPTGLAVGLDGSLYIADPALLRVRRIAPNGTISTVAGTGQACTGPTAGCGDGGSAVPAAQLADPQGVWVDPAGQIYIADGTRGIRRVGLDGDSDRSPRRVASGWRLRRRERDRRRVRDDLRAAANYPDYLLEVNVTAHTMTPSRRHGDQRLQRRFPSASPPATGVQVNRPGSLSVTPWTGSSSSRTRATTSSGPTTRRLER